MQRIMNYIFQLANPRIKPVYFVAVLIIALLAGAVTEHCRRQRKLTKTQSIAVTLCFFIFFQLVRVVISGVAFRGLVVCQLPAQEKVTGEKPSLIGRLKEKQEQLANGAKKDAPVQNKKSERDMQ